MPLLGSTDEIEIYKAFTGAKIGNENKTILKQNLVYVFTLIGLTNFPNEIEEAVLLDYLYDQYSGLSVNEFKQAFKMAAAGKLDCDTAHYQNFSPAYVSKILNAYFVKAREVRRLTERTETKQEPHKIEIKCDWSEVWQDLKEKAKNTVFEKLIFPVVIYDWLEEKGEMKLSVDEKIDLFDSAFFEYRANLHRRVAIGKCNVQECHEYEKIKDLDHTTLKKGSELHSKIVVEAKRLAIKKLLYENKM